jgi:hypothetical protein
MHGIWQSKVFRIIHGERFHVNKNTWTEYVYHMPILCLAYVWHMNICHICASHIHGIWHGERFHMNIYIYMKTLKSIYLSCANHMSGWLWLWHMPGIRIWIFSYAWHMHSICLTYNLIRISDICHIQPLRFCSVPVTYLDGQWHWT